MDQKKFFGVVIPTITPLTEQGKIDEESLVTFCEYLVKAGVNGIYPNGTNGESLMMTMDERRTVARIMTDANQGRMSNYIQCGSMTTAETLSHALYAVEIGADGIGIMSPAFFPMDDEALFRYYSAVLSQLPGNFPVYIYNIPGCTSNDVKPALLHRLMEKFPNIAGIKFSSPDLIRGEDYLLEATRPVDYLIGCDRLFFQCLVSGGVGTVTGPGSVFHERFTRLYRQFQEGDMAGAVKTQMQINATDQKLSQIPGIPALKAMLKMRGAIKTDFCREPVRALTKAEYAILDEVLQEYYEEEGIHE